MRVIAGKARRLLLKTIDGLETRPTTDRIKETLFNMINKDIPGCCFLDLFSGSGSIGIEALSRGAETAVFIEQNPQAAACIRENLESTHLAPEGIVMNCDVLTGLRRLEGQDYRFDIIYMDPPYQDGLERLILQALSGSKLVQEDSVIIIEASKDTNFDYLEELGFTVWKTKTYKTNQHVFVIKGD